MNDLLYITWDIGKDPGIDLDFFVIRYYSLMWILAFALGYQIMKQIFIRENVDLKYLEPFFTYALIGCMLGARIGDCVFYNWDYYHNHLLEILLPFRAEEGASALFGLIKGYKFTGFAGLASHGATLGFMIATYLFHKKYKELDLIWLFDRLVITVPLGGALIRLGNFINSEIVGKPFEGNWAVKFINQHSDYGAIVPRHATQLYEAVGYIILFWVLYFIYTKTDKKEYRGWIFGFFLIGLWMVRFVAEFFKEPQGENEYIAETLGLGLNNGQLLSIPFILLGIYLMVKAKKYKK